MSTLQLILSFRKLLLLKELVSFCLITLNHQILNPLNTHSIFNHGRLCIALDIKLEADPELL